MNNKAHSGLRTPNSSASSSTNNTPVAPNGTFAASGSTNTLRGPAPQYQTFTFGTPAEQEQASRPRRDLREQRERLNASRALQQEAARRAQSQLGGQPPLPMQHGLQPVFNPPQYPPPQPQPLHHPQAYPAGPNPNVPGPSRNALNGTANENAGFGVGHRPLGLHAQTRNAGFPPPPPIPDVSQGPMYGQQLPAPHHYGGHPGPHGHGVASNVAPFGGPYRSLPMRTPPAPAVQPALLQQGQVVPNAAPPPSARQEHMPQLPEGMNPLHQGVRQAPPAHWPPPAPFGQPYHPQQFQQAPMLPVPSVGPVEGGSMRGLKRKAVDDHHKTQTKAKRHRPQGDPNFEPAQSGPDGKLRWKCLKAACANVNPMLEDSVHKHVTQTNSHQTNSPESLTEHICPACGATFKRLDALKRHEPSGLVCQKQEVSGKCSGTPSSACEQHARTCTIFFRPCAELGGPTIPALACGYTAYCSARWE
ncbi:hypothetical protein EV702DRAFT_156205 [Suillus placidus]|uniref:Uncharacterized protein n=1 Tax=Suillus placidus TaxID=48579 RepID=A0A9P6ZZ27_9AGAM|nr:hypothetical protein EV702DRAFT_156205 [Suillus placidus]